MGSGVRRDAAFDSLCFDPDQLQAFDLAEIAGWFKQSSDRIYAKTPPIAEFEVPLTLGPGMHKIDVPPELATVDEADRPTSYKAMSNDDPAFALFVFYLQAGLVEVLPQRWFTASQYQVGKQWISRAARDEESHRIFGECFGVGSFLLEEDGCRLAEWMERRLRLPASGSRLPLKYIRPVKSTLDIQVLSRHFSVTDQSRKPD